MRVAVLGGSHGAYATAADLSLAGHQVRLWRRREADLGPLRTAGGIALVAEGRKELARLDRLTADLTEALAEAAVVIVPLPATAHGDLAGRLAGQLSPRQIVLLTPGTFGTYLMAREIERAGSPKPFAFAETGMLPYLTLRARDAHPRTPLCHRGRGPGTAPVRIGRPAGQLNTPTLSGLLSVFGALLGRDLRGTGRALDRLGLGELTLREIGSLLQEGWLSSVWRGLR